MLEKLNVRTLTQEKLAKMIDHSLLNPTVVDKDLEQGCRLADKYHTATVCVKPYHVTLTFKLLATSGVKVSTVIGFPHGGHLTKIKTLEAEQAILDGAEELDMVMNPGAFKSKNYHFVREDIKAVVNVARKHKGILVKVILENCYLTDKEKITACNLVEETGADYVKTSTGFGTGGATIDDIELMYEAVGSKLRVKTAGGVRMLDATLNVIRAGAAK